jgi:hypothetical protein
MARLIFVAGSGRSGTHLLGRTVGSHPKIESRIEVPFSFKLATRVATRQDWTRGPALKLEETLLMLDYRMIKAFARKPLVLEKSHSSLWLAERLLKAFPDSAFLAVWRDPEPTVASMLRHPGVLSWYRKLPLDVENRFLGITAFNKRTFAALPIEKKCALRWYSHKKEIERLARILSGQVLSIRYEEFAADPGPQLDRISSFLGIEQGFVPERIDLESLGKWKDQLSRDQVRMIREVIEEAMAEPAP